MPPADTVIRGALVVDGTGAPPAVADVAIRGDRITAVGDVATRGGVEVDGRGLALAPGFIDVHSHDDLAVLADPLMACKVMQGVTTDVVGNCGFGAAPCRAGLAMLRGLTGDAPVEMPEWDGHAGYLAALDAEPPSLNVAMLAGHGTLRLAARGDLDTMRGYLDEALAAGCVGFSTGLIYEPGRHAATDELIALARVMAPTGRVYASHIRNEADGLLDAVAEAIRIGTDGGVPVQISHHKASGRHNWGRVVDSLQLIDEARAAGHDVTADQYPYTAGSTALAAVVQYGETSPLGRIEAGNVWFASAPDHPEYEGLTLRDLCERWGVDALDAARRALADEPGALVVMRTMHEDDVRTVLAHPSTMIGSDGLPAPGARPHPRLYGTFPRVLGYYARDEQVLSLPEAVHRMTGMAAAKFGLDGRGVIAPDAFADLVLFDPATVADLATYDDPRRHPDGIAAVWVNGTVVARDGEHTGARPGRALRRR